MVDYEGVGTMSKSKNNGVDPQDLIDRFGADTARLFVMFASPPEQTLEWNDAGVEGAHRFLRRLWSFVAQRREVICRAQPQQPTGASLSPAAKAVRREVHVILRQVTYDYERMQYNTVVSGCMKLLNALEGFTQPDSAADGAVLREGVSILLRTLYPACPHVCSVLWRDLGFGESACEVLDAPWPEVDEDALQQDEISLVLQINGKTRGSLTVSAQASAAQIEEAARQSAEVARFSQGNSVRKVVVVAGRLVNVVV